MLPRGGLKLSEREILEEVFNVYFEHEEGEVKRFFVIPKYGIYDERTQIVLAKLSEKYDVRVKMLHGEIVVELKPHKENYLINIILLALTFLSTTFVGSFYLGEFDLIQGVMFSIAILFVLGSHEMGHYFTSRSFGVRTSLPYFIPFPTIIGTLGAIIKHRGAIPSRKALLAIGAAGPLAGIVASVIVAYIGLKFFEVNIPPEKAEIFIGVPPLFYAVMSVVDYSGNAIHPVAFAGWVGMFITSLNLIPVGQLDGGHIMRALIGEKADTVSKIIPFVLIVLGTFFGSIWFFWGILTLFFGMQKHPKPIDDSPLPINWKMLGVITFALGVACFTPTPFLIPKNLK